MKQEEYGPLRSNRENCRQQKTRVKRRQEEDLFYQRQYHTKEQYEQYDIDLYKNNKVWIDPVKQSVRLGVSFVVDSIVVHH